MSPISNYMPDVKVEIAFNADFTTPVASRTWTDVSAYVELHENIEIVGGRSDARGTIDANALRLSLDNSDGRFTPFLSSSPYYPNVKLGRPIRVTAKPAGSATTYDRFTGYVDSWPTEWIEGVAEYAVARISAASRLARIGRAGVLKSALEVEAGQAGPVHYWTLGDAQGSTRAADSIGNSTATPLIQRGGGSPDVVFGTGTGPPADGLTAATFASGGRYLRADTPDITDDYTLSAFYATTDASGPVIMGVGDAFINLNTSGKLRVAVVTGGGVAHSAPDAGTAVNDGEVHHVALRYDKATNLYECIRDGVVVASITVADAFVGGKIYVGNGGERLAADTLSGTIAHVSLYHTSLFLISLVEIANSGNGFAAEAASSRFSRYARWGSAVIGDVFSDTRAVTPMQAIDSTGNSVGAMLRKVEATEGGILFDNRSGTLVFLSRNARFNRPADVTIPTTAFEAGVAPRLDDSEIFNRATAQVTDDLTVSATDAASIAAYGLYDIPFEVLTTDLNEAEGRCWWTVNQYGEPLIRVPNLSVDVLPLALATQEALADLDLGDRIATSGSWPGQIGTVLASGFFLEGYVETFGPESWVMTFNVTPASVNEVVELNHATYGLIGSYVLAY